MTEQLSKVSTVEGRRVKIDPDILSSIQMAVANPRKGAFTDEWLVGYLARFTVVKTCKACGEPLIAEEIGQHELRHLAPRLRPLARTLLDLSAFERDDLLTFVKDVLD